MQSLTQPAYRPDQISGFEVQLPSLQAGITVKAILNENGIAFFNAKAEHRDQKVLGLSYEDNYKGNALAAMCTKERADIRFHQDFSDARVEAIIRKVLGTPPLAEFAKGLQWSYQGRPITGPQASK